MKLNYFLFEDLQADIEKKSSFINRQEILIKLE